MDYQCHYDVAVTGAGVAGIAAALAAARRGKKVALLEKQTLIGGLATSGLIYIYLPLCDGKDTQVIFGISEEMLKRSMEFSPFDLPQKWGGHNQGENKHYTERYRVQFSPAGFTLSLDEMLVEAGIDLWLDTRVCDVLKSSDRVTALEVENTSGRGRITAGCFVDASGEAIVVRRAGGAVQSDSNSLSMWLIENTPQAAESPYLFTGNVHIKPFRFNRSDIAPMSGTDGKAVSYYTQECYKKLREFYRQSYQSSDRFQHYPLHLPAMPQFRKIAAAQCQFMLDDKDVNCSFEDSIGMTGDWRLAGPVWETPFRALVPESLDGVYTAGRCMGAINDAWEVYRVIPTAAMTGEAAGVAAALAVEKNCATRDLKYQDVQQELRKQNIPLHFEDVNLTV